MKTIFLMLSGLMLTTSSYAQAEVNLRPGEAQWIGREYVTCGRGGDHGGGGGGRGQPLAASVTIVDCKGRASNPGAVTATNFRFASRYGRTAVYVGSATIPVKCGSSGSGTVDVTVEVSDRADETRDGQLSNQNYIYSSSCRASGLLNSCSVHSFNSRN